MWVVGKGESQERLSQMLRLIDQVDGRAICRHRRGLGQVGLKERKFSGYAKFELPLGCTTGDIEHASDTCTVHQNFLFSSQTCSGLHFSAHLNLDQARNLLCSVKCELKQPVQTKT